MLLDSLVFLPDRVVPRAPRGVEERWIYTADRIRLHAWYIEGDRAGPTLVWSHGNAGNIAGRVDVQLALAAAGVNVLAYDYRGYGKSGGRPSEEGVYRDSEAAFDAVYERGASPTRIVAFGESLGGAVSIALAGARPCGGVIVVSTFTSLRDVAWEHFGPLAVLASGFNSLERVRQLHLPLLVAHGDRDEVVPYRLGELLYAAANEPKRFVRAAGAHHNDVFATPRLIETIARFARDVEGSGGRGR